MNNPTSFNNRLIVEKYVKGALRTTERNGFAIIDQKLNLKGLKVLVDSYVTVGSTSWLIYKDSIAYIKEELLHTQPWAQKALESDAIQGQFLIVDVVHVEF